MGYCPRMSEGLAELRKNEYDCPQNNNCEWWDNRHECCAILAISFGLNDLQKMMTERN
jgi:hypothetical protein